MNFNLFETDRSSLFPLCLTRPIGSLRVGIFTIVEKWETVLHTTGGFHTEKYLRELFPSVETNLYINARWLPTDACAFAINNLKMGQALVHNNTLLCAVKTSHEFSANLDDYEIVQWEQTPKIIHHIWDLFVMNGEEIQADYDREDLTDNGINQFGCSHLYGDDIYIHPTATVRGVSLNAEEGPIYIGPNTEIMEGALIRGPFALLDHSVVKMGAKIYGSTTIGPHSKVGGEISNSVILGFSNKAHDGFLGNSLIGQWCNLGADSNCSNLKNNYGAVSIWDYSKKKSLDTGLTFCGLIMGDHSKTAINTQFNTGTVVGVSCNIFDSGFPPKFIPSFSWGSALGFDTFDFEKAVKVASKVYQRRKLSFGQQDHSVLRHIFDMTKEFRR